MTPVKLTSENFDQTIAGATVPVLVDFWATWCGPCRMLAPVLEQIAEEKDGALIVGKIDVDEEPGLAVRFGISLIPAVLVFKNGELIAKSEGYRPKDEILSLI